MRFMVFAPAGIGEVSPGCDLVATIASAVDADPDGPLQSGDIVVVTSKIISKAEDRYIDASAKQHARRDESQRVVAKRGGTVIVQHRLGLVHAAAGIDQSNVEPERALLLPHDPDAAARALHSGLSARYRATLGVIVSDTAGRAWRTGQTDLAIGVAGIVPVDSHLGLVDGFGNELHVTEIAVADELAAAADLAKAKLAGRPVAVIRGLGHLLTADHHAATELQRDSDKDMFRLGVREAVLEAVLRATGQEHRFDELVELEGVELADAVCAGAPDDASWIRRVLRS